MNATIMKGERSKLLAVAVVIAMVACALVAFVPSSDAADGPVDAADSYPYTDGFEYTGERTVVGDDVIMVYPQAYDAAMLAGMNDDFPRFIGALYRADDGATVSSITYNGVEYTWNTQGTLKGSNWVDAEGKTLVAAVASELGNNITSMISTGGSITLTLGLVDGTSIIMTYTVSAPVASIGETYYGTLPAAVEAVKDGQTITLNKNAADENGVIQGNGVKFETNNYTITLDFNGLTYDINGTTVGSTGTETNGFQLLKDNNVTLKNGTITSTSPTAWIILQNYCNLTLDDFTVDASNNPKITYASSNNNGSVTYSGETNIIASEGNVAFDVCGFSSYPGVVVTIADDFTGSIDGKVEVTYDASNPSTGTMNLNINADVTLDTLVINNGTVTIAEDVTVTAETVTVGSDAVLSNSGSIIGDVKNNGYVITNPDSGVAEAGSFDALLNAIADTNVKTIYLVGDEPFVANTWITSEAGRNLTIDLNGRTLDMGTYPMNLAGIKLIVSSGSTFSTDDRIGYVENMTTQEGSYVDLIDAKLFKGMAGSGTTDANVKFATFGDGTIVPIKLPMGEIVDYTVFHTINNGVTIQFGIAFGLEYNGENQAGPLGETIPVASLDNNYDTSSGNASGYIYELGYDVDVANNKYGKVIDADTEYGVNISFNMGSTTNPALSITLTNVRATVFMSPTDPTVSVDIEDWTIGEYDDETNAIVPSYTGVTIDGVAYDFDDFTYAGGEVEYKFFTKNDETYTLLDVTPEDYSELEVGTYYVKAYFTAVKNYNAAESGYVEFKVTEAQLDMGISAVDGDTIVDINGVGDKPVSYYQDIKIESVTDPEANCQYKISGTLNYVTGNTIYGGEQQSGYYLVFNITNGQDFEVPYYFTVNDDERGYGNTVDPGSELMIVWIPDVTDLDNLQITFELKNYEPKTITICVSELYRNTVSGYAAAETDAENQMIGNGILTDAEKDDVGAMTMWMAFDTKGAATAQAYLYYGDSEDAIYSQKMENPAPTGRWYFSFDPANGSYIGLNSTINPCLEAFNAYKEANSNAAPGAYTMEIVLYDADGAEIETVTSVAYIEGMVDNGFEYFGDDAETGIKDAYKDSEYVFDKTDVDDKTLWFTWYQGQEYDDITITVTKDGVDDITYLEPKEGVYDLKAGLHTFYASFNNQLSAFAEDPLGTYTVTVKAGTEVIASEDVTVKEAASDYIIGELTEEYLGKAPQEYMDIVFGDLAEGKYTITGEVFYLDAWDAYWTGNDNAGYYIGIVITDAEGNPIDSKYWDNATGSVDNPNNTKIEQPKVYAAGEMDGVFVLYLGDDKTDLATLKDITVSIDLDGNGPFLTATEYTLVLDITEGIHTYTVTYIDEEYGTTGYKVTEYIAGNILTLPVVPDTTKEALGWDVDGTGVLYKCGTRIDLSQLDTDKDYTVTFYAKYGPSTGGSTGDEPNKVFQLNMYTITAEPVDGGIHVTISVDPELLDEYYCVLNIARITITDYSDDGYAPIVVKPFLSINPGQDGIVYDDVITGDIGSQIGVAFDGWVADEWLDLGNIPDGTVWIETETPETPLLDDDFGGVDTPMTFDIVEAPADAPADNNYPWLQINYERTADVDSIELIIDGETVSITNWVDSDGKPITEPTVYKAGVAYFQLSFADGDITPGEHAFAIKVASGEITDEITMTYTVPSTTTE